MKFGCMVDGIHFPQDFKKTLKPPCNFWGDMGLSNLSVKLKKKMWDWIFSMPTDEIGVEAKIGIAVSFKTIPLTDEDFFINKIKGYNLLDERSRQELQREIFKRKMRGENVDEFIEALDFTLKEERRPN